MPDSDQIVIKMIGEELKKLSYAVTKLDDRVRDEIARNNERHSELTVNHVAMKGDIRVVSARVATIVSLAVGAVGLFFKKFWLD